MDSVTAIIILRLLHVVIGAAWLGAVVMMTFFLSPTVRAMGPVGGQFVGALMQRTHLPVWLLAAGAITILSGLGLYWMFYAGIALGCPSVRTSPTASAGSSRSSPLPSASSSRGRPERASPRLSKAIASQGAPPSAAQAAERDALSRRLAALALVNALLLIAATALMAVGRYL